MLRYKIVETSTVTAPELERIVNEWLEQEWEFDGFHFVTNPSSHRPVMAFITFTSPPDDDFDDDLEEDSSGSN